MIIHPRRNRARSAALCTLAALTAPAWLVAAAIVGPVIWLAHRHQPPVWWRMFALWPIRCDQWAPGEFSGWVWLEFVWRNDGRELGSWYRRAAPM